MNTFPHWTAYLSALLTPVVAAFGIYIAWRQSRTAQNKLKLDLFDRRFSVYDQARSLLATIMTSGAITDEALWKFGAGVREARWLFDSAVEDYLRKELWNNAVNLQMYTSELEGLPVGEARSDLVEKRADIKKWFFAQYEVLDAKVEPFLKLRH